MVGVARMNAAASIDDEWFEVTAEELAYLADVKSGAPSPLERLSPIGAWMRSADARAEGARLLGARTPELADVDVATWQVILRLAAIVGDPDDASIIMADSSDDAGVELVTCASPLGRAQLVVMSAGSGLRPIPEEVPIADLATSLDRTFPADVAPILLAIRLRRGGVVEGIRWDGVELSQRSDDGSEIRITCAREDALSAIAAFVIGPRVAGHV
jgi:hypothetical protein